MNFLPLTLASLVLALAGCSTTGSLQTAPAPEPAAVVGEVAPAPVPPLPVLQTPGTPQARATSPAIPQASAVRPAPAASIVPAGPLAPLTENHAASLTVTMLTPPTDLWERIRRGFAMPDLQGDLVRDREQWYATRPDYMARMTERGRKYLFHIVEELERRNMPSELALLPFIESAFNPQAVSSAKAAGMWQFMPATGKSFELTQNAFRDDRRDVLASTRAALDYLQKLHRMFGDWHLALAAYNWGEGSVGRAIARNRAAGLGTSYTELTMPAETRLYVPKLQAVKNLVAAPQAYGATLPIIDNHPYFQTVTINRDIDVALAARLAEVDVNDFRALNPSLNRPVILAAGTPQILLPWDNAAIFTANLQAQGDAQLATWMAWQAPGSMKPADVARRVGMSEKDLRDINRIPNGVLIKAGSTLLVPRPASVRHDVTEHVADTAQLNLSPLPLLARRSVRAAKGDTVASVARRYRVPASSVADWNNVAASASFRTGQAVTLYLAARATAPAKVAKAGGKGKGKKAAVAKSRAKGKPVKLARH